VAFRGVFGMSCRSRSFSALHAFVIMPDHVHALLTPGEQNTLEKAVQMIKGGSSFRIRKQLGYRWPIWHGSFHDRWMRDAEEYFTRKRYIEANPVSGRLVQRPAEWQFSSATGRFQMDPSRFDAVSLSG
jgi:putative transposase